MDREGCESKEIVLIRDKKPTKTALAFCVLKPSSPIQVLIRHNAA
jgi:hypothetical protein